MQESSEKTLHEGVFEAASELCGGSTYRRNNKQIWGSPFHSGLVSKTLFLYMFEGFDDFNSCPMSSLDYG